MRVNYHTHTKRCKHAGGTVDEYINSAIDAGLSVLGFSDHTPYIYDTDYVSPAKMDIEELGDYCAELICAKEKYKGQIDIKIGLETEYFPAFFEKLLKEYEKHPLEYIILGQHFVGSETKPDAVTSFNPTSDRSILTRYVDQCKEALGTNLFSCFAHPDVLNFCPKDKSDETFMKGEFARLIRAAIDTKTPLEINLCGFRFKRNYPNPIFWELAGEYGAEVIVGCDAHAPAHIAVPEEIRFTEELISRNHLKAIDLLPLKKPFF